GSGPFADRWQIEAAPAGSNVWTDLADGPLPGGAAVASNSGTATLNITSTQSIGPVRFRCRVGNACGSANSNPATLTVFASSSGDGNASGATDGDDIQALLVTLVQGG